MTENPNSYAEVTTVLLAGGFGTRVAHLLPNIPKPMALVSGRPFIEWVIRYFSGFGLRRFALSTGHLADVIETYFAGRPVQDIDVSCHQETSPLGTAGGFLNAGEGGADPAGGWLVANGDSLVVCEPTGLIDAARSAGWQAAVLGLEVPDASRYGSLGVDGEGRLLSFAEKRSGAGLINAGVYWFAPGCRQLFSARRPLSFELDVFPGLIEMGVRIGVVPVAVPFIDIGTPASMAEAEAFVSQNLKKQIQTK